MASPIEGHSLLALNPAKFSGKEETLLHLHSDVKKVIYRFPKDLDTQGLATNSKYIFLTHHQYHRLKGAKPLTIIKKSNYEEVALADHTGKSPRFPTTVIANEDKLVVAANGADFAATLHIYDISKNNEFQLASIISLSPDQARPMGMALDRNHLYFASYSEQSIWSLNLITGTFKLIIDGKRYGITTPIAITLTDSYLFVSSHIDKSVFKFDRRYFLPIAIYKNDLDLPWSSIAIGNDLFTGNLGPKITANFYKSFVTKNGHRITESVESESIDSPIICLF